MMQNFRYYKKSALDFCKKTWRLHKSICILAFLIVIVLSLSLCSVKKGNDTEKAALQLMATADKIRNFYQTKPNYWGLDNQFALKNGLLSDFHLVDEIPYNALERKVFVGYGPLGDTIVPGINGFDITFTDISYTQCVNLLTFPLSQNQGFGLQQILVYDAEENLVSSFGWGEKNALPVSAQNAKSYCAKRNNLVWHFG